jgi:inner membrane protein
MEMLADLVYWHWLAIAVGLAIVEMLVPGTSMLWLGAAAAVTGALAWLFPALSWQWQIFIFGVVGIGFVAASRRYLKIAKSESEDPLLNHRFERLVGKTVVLESAIVNGHGRIPVDDGSFLVSGPDLPAGSKVKIVSVDGAVLQVEEVK